MELQINREKQEVIIIKTILEKEPNNRIKLIEQQELFKDNIETAFGDIIAEIYKVYPPDKYYNDPVNYTVQSTWRREKKAILGFDVYKNEIITIYEMLKNKDKLELTLQDMEDIRLSYSFNIQFQPLDKANRNGGMVFTVKSLSDVVYGLLYFSAYYGIKMKKCDHCGRWFTTETFQKKDCERKSPVEKYSHLQCSRAAKVYKKKLRERENAIIKSWKSRKDPNIDQQIFDLQNTCNDLLVKLSIENLQTLDRYLYADDKPKQTRPNRKKKQIGD